MKIAFVNDSCERLGVEYISAVLKQAGHETKLFVDPQFFDDENISIKWLSRHFDYKKRIIQDLKAYKPNLIILLRILPRFMFGWIIKYKTYRFIPLGIPVRLVCIGYFFLGLLINLFS